MSRAIITNSGEVVYRTSLFHSVGKAEGFAKCVRANRRFTDVLVSRSDRSKNDAWFVTFKPSSLDRQTDMLQAQWDQRLIAGQTSDFIFYADSDQINKWWCFSVQSGETYEVTLGDCSCPDYHYRCQKAGIQCKHMQAWSHQRRNGQLGRTDKQTLNERFAAYALNVNCDF